MRLNLLVTNNVAEYKALITGLELARKIRARKVIVQVDSQLIAKQVSGEYEANEPILFSYHQEVQSLIFWFNIVEIKKIPREQNSKVDNLSKLAAAEEEDGGYPLLNI